MTLLLDTGPLVAAIDRSDKHHARCAALLQSAEGPLLIPTTVIVEVCWLLEERPDIEAAFLTSVAAANSSTSPSPPPTWRVPPSLCVPTPTCHWARSTPPSSQSLSGSN